MEIDPRLRRHRREHPPSLRRRLQSPIAMIDVLLNLLHFDVLIPWLLGMAFGVFVGATPGLTATMAVALIIPFTFYLHDPNTGLALTLGISFTAIFAGDIPSVYLRIP